MAGDAADDFFDAVFEIASTIDDMLAKGCRACRHCADGLDVECPVCNDTGWLGPDGKPVEI